MTTSRDASQVAPLSLDGRQDTHVLAHAVERLVLDTETVTAVARKSDGVPDGRFVVAVPDGRVWLSGAFEVGVPSGTWTKFDGEGALEATYTWLSPTSYRGRIRSPEYTEEGVFRLLGEEMSLRRDPSGGVLLGPAARDGRFVYFRDGEPTREAIYRDGRETWLPPMDLFRAAAMERDVERLLGLGRHLTVAGLEALRSEGVTLDAETLFAVVAKLLMDTSSFPHHDLARSELVTEQRAALAPSYSRWLATQTAHDRRQMAFGALWLHTELSDEPFGDEWDDTFLTALANGSDATDEAILRNALSRLPLSRRERLVLSGPFYPFFDVAPTEAVCARLLATVAKYRGRPNALDDAWWLLVDRALAAFGRGAGANYIAWLAGPGRRSTGRTRVLRALADARIAEAVPTFLTFLTDGDPEEQELARLGLVRLGQSARPALEKVAGGRKSKLRDAVALILPALDTNVLAEASVTLEASDNDPIEERSGRVRAVDVQIDELDRWVSRIALQAGVQAPDYIERPADVLSAARTLVAALASQLQRVGLRLDGALAHLISARDDDELQVAALVRQSEDSALQRLLRNARFVTRWAQDHVMVVAPSGVLYRFKAGEVHRDGWSDVAAFVSFHLEEWARTQSEAQSRSVPTTLLTSDASFAVIVDGRRVKTPPQNIEGVRAAEDFVQGWAKRTGLALRYVCMGLFDQGQSPAIIGFVCQWASGTAVHVTKGMLENRAIIPVEFWRALQSELGITTGPQRLFLAPAGWCGAALLEANAQGMDEDDASADAWLMGTTCEDNTPGIELTLKKLPQDFALCAQAI